MDFGSLLPIDEALVEDMRECEAVFMDMVARLEWKRQISFQTRRRWYLRHLRFWNDYIERHRINLYLSAWTPHEIPDIIIYYLCKKKGISVLFFECASMLRDTSFAEHDWEEGAIQIRHRYEELLREYNEVTDPLCIPLTPSYEERYRALTSAQGSKPPAYYRQWKPQWDKFIKTVRQTPAVLLRYAAQYCTLTGIKRLVSTWQRRRVIRARNAFYDTHAIMPDLNRPFVYLPLHFQPEQATTPLAGGFADQILIVGLLNSYLPDGVSIYVKEHPWDSGWLNRSVDSYKDFLELPKVRLIARSVDTFALREHCRAVATATGTAGAEALFRGKPVLLFGHRFYQYAPGVYRIRSADDCARAIHAIFVEQKAPTLFESRLHLKAMEDTRVHGALDPEHVDVSELPGEVHSTAHSQAILDKLAQWFN